MAVVVVVVVVYGVLAVAVLQVMDFQRRGSLPFAAFLLFDVTAEAGEIRPQPFLPVSAAPAETVGSFGLRPDAASRSSWKSFRPCPS